MSLKEKIEYILNTYEIPVSEDALKAIDEAVLAERIKLSNQLDNESKFLQLEYKQKVKELDDFKNSIKLHLEATEEVAEEIQQENDALQAQNDRLWSRLKENGNQTRGVHPKKERSGFIFTSAQQYEEHFNIGYDYAPIKNICWKTIFETPYPSLLTYGDVKNKVDAQMIELLAELGCNIYDPAYIVSSPVSECICYKMLFSVNRNGFWEVRFYTTTPLTISADNIKN